MKPNIVVRVVTNEESETLRNFLTEDMYDDLADLDWSDIEPYWFGAYEDDELVGCCQVLVGHPVGIIEFICFKAGMHDMHKARILKMLAKSSLAGLKAAGASAVATTVAFELNSFKNILKRKWGSVVYASGNLLMKKLV